MTIGKPAVIQIEKSAESTTTLGVIAVGTVFSIYGKSGYYYIKIPVIYSDSKRYDSIALNSWSLVRTADFPGGDSTTQGSPDGVTVVPHNSVIKIEVK